MPGVPGSARECQSSPRSTIQPHRPVLSKLYKYVLIATCIPTHCQVLFQNKDRHVPRQCPICRLEGIHTVYTRIGDHVRRHHKLSADQARTVMSEQRAATGKSRTRPRNYYACGVCQ
ncbi:hypothetical protein DPMN_059205 [Dreissena polymorpha]|uniref:Uncharacterized protein n=1 Tax=Dreissena polymorpha TaxID=45954 RepID=A0A9D4C3K0_DREPO|nr:hypothetical protein DPMN_059205 [Dreissena polymorpha]